MPKGERLSAPRAGRAGMYNLIESLENRLFLSASQVVPHRHPAAVVRTPFAGAIALPAVIQAENFDVGGEGTTYHDTTTRNLGKLYRPAEGVDIFKDRTPSTGGYYVADTAAGEWMEYTVSVDQPANYSLSFRVGNFGTGGQFHLNVDGKRAAGPFTVPNTGQGNTWTVMSAGSISLAPGTHVLRLVMDSQGKGGQTGRFDWLSLAALAPVAPGVLTATPLSNTSVSLTWRDRSDNETAFSIERTTDLGLPFEVIGTVRSNKKSFVDTGLTPTTTYYYRVQALNTGTASAYTDVATATTPTDVAPTFDGPITITQGGTYTGNWQSLDPNTPAVTVATSEPVIIQDSNIQSRGVCISADAGGDPINLTVRNVTGTGLNPNVAGDYVGRFLDVQGWASINVEHNSLQGTSGIYLYSYVGNHTSGQTVKVLYNQVLNVDGRVSDGSGGFQNVEDDADNYKQFFQINGTLGLRGAEVGWNQVINQQGASRPEENINIFDSGGTADSPFSIHDNYIQGAYPANAVDARTFTGGGIMVSDQGSSYVHATSNQIVNTGSIGIEISSGHDNAIDGNTIISSGEQPDGSLEPWSNTGIVIWNPNGESTFARNEASNNTVGWVGADGSRNDWYIPAASSFVNNTSVRGTVTPDTETAQFTLWQQKLSTAGNTVGPA